MQEFEHIQSLWHSHTVNVKISADEMLSQAKREVSSIKTKSMLNIIGMIVSFVALVFSWLFLDFNSWTTHVGLTIIITSIAVSTFILYKEHKLLSKSDVTAHPHEFLSQLKLYQTSRFRLYNSLYWFYALGLTLGAMLYFFEVLSYFNIWMQILIVTLTLAWMLFCSTIVRKAVIKREKERISLLIEKFERISEQFQDTELPR